jgi:hypothetical protein
MNGSDFWRRFSSVLFLAITLAAVILIFASLRWGMFSIQPLGIFLFALAVLWFLRDASVRRTQPELLLIALVFVLGLGSVLRPSASGLPSGELSRQATVVPLQPTIVPLQLKVSDLASGAVRAQADEFVTLVLVTGGGDGKEPGTVSYSNLQLSDLLDANGRSARYTGVTPDSILLSVPADQRDAIVKGLAEKTAAYLLPQGTATISPIETPTLTAEYQGSEWEEFELKVSDVDGGAALFEPNEYRDQRSTYVRLVIVSEKSGTEGKESETSFYHDVQIVDLLDAGGRPVVASGATPGSILLSVPKGKLDEIIKGLEHKEAVYLLPQGMQTVTPIPSPTATITPEKTITPSSNTVVFDLPYDKIKSDFGSLRFGESLLVLVVVEEKDVEDRLLSHQPHRYGGARLLAVLDAKDTVLPEPYKGAATVRISLPLNAENATDLDAEDFAAHLADASAIYLLESTPTPTQTPTQMPTSTPTVTPTGEG